MNKKILIIGGQTAVGKTAMAIYLAKKFKGQVISADSRQVYKSMDVGTGKEWDKSTPSIPIHGYDLVSPNENFSVHDFFKFASLKIKEIVKAGDLPILVGGTGFYIDAVLKGIETINVPKNEELRDKLYKMKKEDLFDLLATVDSTRSAMMNNSDRNNTRRIIRAIEIAYWKISNSSKYKKIINKSENFSNYDKLYIGLSADDRSIKARIRARVLSRIEDGFFEEVEDLLNQGIDWNMQSMQTLGYKEVRQFMKDGLSYEDFVSTWVNNEYKYSKRQMTWFKKNKETIWFDATDTRLVDRVENVVRKWHNKSD